MSKAEQRTCRTVGSFGIPLLIEGRLIKFRGLGNFEFILHRTLKEERTESDKWRVTEASTGAALASGRTPNETLKNTKKNFHERLCKTIQSGITLWWKEHAEEMARAYPERKGKP